MQFDSLRAFPYPVLRPDVDDYVDGEMQVTVDMKSSSKDGKMINADVHFVLSVKDIQKLIQDKKATYTIVFACRDTYFRRAYSSDSPNLQISFPEGALQGEVQAYPYVVAANDITGFKCDLINPEFGKGPFSFAQGSLLAVDAPQSVFIDRDVFKSLNSVFELVKSDNISNNEWQLDTSGDKVKIIVSPRLKERIDIARNDPKNRAILLNSIYFSAVMQCLTELKSENAPDDAECKWARVFRQKSFNMGLDLNNHSEYMLAQKLMSYPFARIDAYLEGDSNE
jgi:hypothetical protein